jgi:hypothetical protein
MVSAFWSQVNGIKACDSVGSRSTTIGREDAVMQRRRALFRQRSVSAGPPCFSVDVGLSIKELGIHDNFKISAI